ncbi:coiled-coil domain-containing protein [Stieleria varia]|uniref:Chromosome partition protein Smc n=1 Tax=Stieleria varia TaxID=2528005 RepID=A0A5C6A551_9BACT|nr:hypothetical protein [Stieleria varia]TWT94599.1 hypothetical protein Pla52n_54200 [Stieleria varia]
MPISGPVIHRQLMDGYKEAQARLEALRGRVQQVDQKRGELDDFRSEALVDLAEHYLPELTRDAIRNTWVEVRATVSQILLRQEDHCNRLKQSLSELNDKRHLQDDRLLELNEKLDAALAEQDELGGKVEAALKSDAAFVTLSDRAAMAEAALERAESNLSEIEQDSARKLPAYEKSSLFKYLKDRQFGTAEYKKRGITRRMDRWLAKLIDFRKAKQGYEFLKQTPERMRQIIADDHAAFETVMSELESHQEQVAKRLGLTDKVAEVEGLQAQRAQQLQELEQIREQSEGIEQELSELEDPRGPHYREAIEAFRAMLERSSTRDLERRARATVEVTDDQIVARLNGVEADLADLDAAERRRQDDLAQSHGFLEALGRMIQRFRAAEFDSSRSQFVGTFDVIEDLSRARTEYDLDALWQKIRKSQRWGPTLGEQITNVATHPVTQVLISAMAQAAGAALRDHARSAGRRRYRGSNWYGGSADSSDDFFRAGRR